MSIANRHVHQGRTALVTGASRGIGRAIAERLAHDGWNLILVARSTSDLDECRRGLIRNLGVHVWVVARDLSVPGAAQIVMAELSSHGLTVDLLVNNAGFGDFGPFVRSDFKIQEAMIGVNVLALTGLTRLLLPGMVERGRGTIINMASTAALRPGPLLSVYSATKAFVVSFTESLACELAGTGVTALAICPGPTNTSFRQIARMPDANRGRPRSRARAEDVANLVVEAMARPRVLVIHGLRQRWLARLMYLMPRALQARIVLGHRTPNPPH